MNCFRMLYSRLFMTTNVTGNSSCAAVHSACGEYSAAPSPTRHTTGSRPRPSEQPTAAGMPQPSAPPRRKEYCRDEGLPRKPRKCSEVAIASSTIAMSGPIARAACWAATSGVITAASYSAAARCASASRRRRSSSPARCNNAA